MAIVESKERLLDAGVRGKFGKPWEYGEKIYGQIYYGEEEIEFLLFGYGVQQYGDYLYGSDNYRWGIYQKRHSFRNKSSIPVKYFGPIKYIRQNFYQCVNPKKEAQQNWRDVFRQGMATWKLLTEEEQELYNKNARKYHMHGVNLFLREWLNSH